VVSAPCRPVTGSSIVRMVWLGAQPSTDIGMTSAMGY
jgi:hypothetical protein